MGSNAPSSFQSPETQFVSEAIGILKDEDDRDIFAWIKLARTLEQSSRYHPDHTCLTRDQVRAIGALRHCTINDISAWLHCARMPGSFGIPSVVASSQPYGRVPDQGHTALSILSDAFISGSLDHSSHDVPNRQALTEGASAQPFPTTTMLPSQAKPKYCCTLCGFLRPFKNQSDWRKHEKEHDTRYVCLLKGPREATPQGVQCAFCGILNPLDSHLSAHNARTCLQGSVDSFSSKRRHYLVNHLSKIHGIHVKSQGEAIAVKWKHTVEKQAWSCGFCVITFVTFHDRLSHIANQHFERGQTMDEWDTTNVIQGLLQQSGMTKAWEEKLASLPTWEVEDMIWERGAVINLQHDLEVGPNNGKSAVELAEAAYVACRLNWGMETQRAVAPAEANYGETLVSTQFSPNPFQASLVSAPRCDLDDRKSLSAIQEFNKVPTVGLATHATAPLDYSYSSASTDSSNDNNNTDQAPSSFYPQQTELVNTHQGNDD